jgi:hypothetical protein
MSPSAIGTSGLVAKLAELQKRLPRLRFVSSRNKGEIGFHSAGGTYGPITFTRRKKGQHWSTVRFETISTNILERIAAQIEPYVAFSVDAVLNSTGNNRSVLEALLAHHSEFYVCYPGKFIDGIPGQRKFLMWCPDNPHRMGIICETDNIPNVRPLNVPLLAMQPARHPDKGFEKLRIHQQSQVKLFETGAALRLRVWLAENDQNIMIGGRRLSSHPYAISHLSKLPLLQAYPAALQAARHLDVMFVRDDGYIPAVVEVEQTTGITSGLTRMNRFRHALSGVYACAGTGAVGTSFIICAADEKAEEFASKASDPQFAGLNPRFLAYSTLDAIWSLIRDNRQDAFSDNLFKVFSDPLRA